MRQAGILMPVASLPNRCGVGDFGESSFTFIDIVQKSGLKIWQILPLNPLGYGNSPYQPYSSSAMDDLYVSLDLLKEEGLIHEPVRNFKAKDRTLDYDEVRAYKQHYLRLAFENFEVDEDASAFFQLPWVYPYAVFLTFKKANRMICWNEWPNMMKNWVMDREMDLSPYEEDIHFEMFVQYYLYKQWMKVKEYANKKGIEIMGDIPFYVGIDSDDVWVNQKCFLLDEEGKPSFIAGVPPDYFSSTGQRWGNPIYNWSYIKKHHFDFWIQRLMYSSTLFDSIRIDHFRAFDTYWKIPSSCPTAIEGKWIEAPGYALFDTLFEKAPDIHIVAEDLGDLREEVLVLRDHYNFKGMRIVQFSFDPSKEEKDRKNLLIYTGTHDNQTIRSWYSGMKPSLKKKTQSFMKKHGYTYDCMADNFIQYTLDSNAEMAIIPLMDFLHKTDKARLNTPGTVGNPNWQWRMTSFKELDEKADQIKKMVKKARR